MIHLPDPPTSLWLDTYGAYLPSPALESDLDVDVAIIGGGFTGLMTAYELKLAEPSLRVAVLEARFIGYGASGRNGSFAMTVIGLGFGTTALLRGRQFLKDAHAYMERAVETLDELISRERLDCDRLRPGFLRVATTHGYIKRLKHDIHLMQSLGFEGIDWLEAREVQARLFSARYLGAMWEPRCLLVNPAKLVREEKLLALRAGIQVFENTPVLEINTRPIFRLKTPEGTVTTEKLVFATNAYSHQFPQLRRKQIPAFTYMIATGPLSVDQLEPIGWQGYEAIEDARNLVHYYRLTPDHRFVMGGGPVGLTWADDLNADNDTAAWRHLEEHMRFLFPSLSQATITHRWGGPFAVPLDLTPCLGYLGDRRAVYSLGYVGHGVSMSHLNAQVLRDLLLERQSDLLDCPMINRLVIPWPPEPLRSLVARTLRGYLGLEDRLYEQELRKQPLGDGTLG
jgi:glycine/D-amino acid oxidase-like deaminating enzyme